MTPFESAMLKPAACYQSPRQVLLEPWSPQDKFRVLRQWQYDIGQLHLATEENMAPAATAPDPVSLEQIHAVMTELGYDPDAESAPTKGA